MKGKLLSLCALAITTTVAEAKVNITESKGWFESAYVKWANDLTNYSSYNVYYKASGDANYTKLDKELVRNYVTYGRADIVGIKAGKYTMKVVPVKSDGTEDTAEAAETAELTAIAHDRTGFAFSSMTEGKTNKAGVTFNAADGLGAYKTDGTLKDNARVVYVTANNAKSVSLAINTGSKEETFTGIQQIIYGYQKGADARPLCIRIVGTITDSDCDKFLSSAEGIQIKGANDYMPMNITIEGIGDDATVWGFGFLIRSACSVELRNFGIMLCMDDCVSIDTKNEHIWIHNLDLFYGNTGGDSDQAKGDGTLDLKGNSKYLTFSYNHLWDSGKASLCGMKSETGPNYITYHHNWFDHSDSRHPRVRTMSVHVYNNYFDGNSKYGVGVTSGGSAFVEANYFRNCKYPMLISKQGTDATGEGTFSGENGGVIKAFNNTVKNAKRLVYYAKDNTEFDAYEVSSRSETVPSSVTAKAGGTHYDNFDTDNSIMYACTPDAPETVPATVTGWLGAGRMGHGDYQWQFNNKTEDENYGVIAALKSELNAYKSSLYDLYDGVKNTNYGTFKASGGDSEKNEDYVPTYDGADTGDDDDNIVVAQKWVFTSWSSESQNTIKDASNGWTQKSEQYARYEKTVAQESLGLSETEGLTFNGKVMVSFDASKGYYIQGSMSIFLNVEEGDIVSVNFSNTGAKNGSRDLLINGEVVASSASTSQVTGRYTVPEGVTVVEIKGSESLNIMSISILKQSGEDNGDAPNGIKEAEAEVVAVEYYTLGGARLSAPQRGLNIVRTILSDGSSKAEKIIRK